MVARRIVQTCRIQTTRGLDVIDTEDPSILLPSGGFTLLSCFIGTAGDQQSGNQTEREVEGM